ncbi:hepatocyte cell adhesion molecule-like isoform X1 [Clupea harengus]|uniref:Hepatocyte cell adhesion molecule-like isoform X1 n=1 Tax=Clupea harengus TaxID=7950 RepID=A0A6P8FN62_CLUHA|nr:hepatocyte cell adhesion molecule-like isoform X1 [Clupea harengus]
MQAVLLLLLLAGASKGLDSTCDATQDAACYGALGGPVYLQLMRNTSGHTLSFHNERKAIFTLRPSKTVFYKDYNTPSFLQRWQFVPDNGTLIINPAERKDAGTYRVRIFNKSTGKSVGEHTVQLIIEAPVSDVDLSISCSANEEWRVRCSSNGDSPQYSWYLDGRPLSEADADLSADIQTLLLNGNVTGELTCSVSNHVNSTNTSVLLLDVCSGISSVFISVWLAEIIILTSLLVGGYYIYIRNKRTHTPDERKDQEVELTPTSSY